MTGGPEAERAAAELPAAEFPGRELPQSSGTERSGRAAPGRGAPGRGARGRRARGAAGPAMTGLARGISILAIRSDNYRSPAGDHQPLPAPNNTYHPVPVPPP